MSKSRPEETIRDGALKATIWVNEGDKGPYFTTSITKSYRDDQGQYRDTSSFYSSELLQVSELARQAYGRTNELRREFQKSRDKDAEDVVEGPTEADDQDRTRERTRPRARGFNR